MSTYFAYLDEDFLGYQNYFTIIFGFVIGK